MSEVEATLLPKSWIILPLSEAIQLQKGKKPHDLGDKSNLRTIPYINIKAFEKGIVTEYAPKQDAVYCTEKDVLLVWDGARAGFSGRGVNGYVGSTLVKVTSDIVEMNYLSYYFESIYSILNTQTKGVGIPHINPVVLNNLPFNLAPEKEQTRIVDKLEELFSELDAGVKELKAAQTKLSQYRQSLLKSAVEGSLTQQWRAENSDRIQETGEQLLARILKQRREQWQQQKLAEFAEKGKTPPKNWQDKYPEPVQPDTTDLPELPEGWVWASLSQIGWLDRGKSKHRPRNAEHLYGGVYPFVQTGEIRSAEQYIRHTEKTYSEEGLKQSKLWPKGTMCITIAANIGETAILDIDACFPDSIVGFSTIVDDMPIEYVEYVFRVLKHKLDDEAPATAQKNINLEILYKETIPLPPVIEQLAIVEYLNTELDNIKLQKTSTALGLKQSEAQRKNILKSAFSGQLVPQDPNDEPASVLLEKIKQEREALAKKPKTKQIKTKSAMKIITVEELTKWVSDYEGNSFTFGELQKTFKGDYDQLKDCVFEILSAKEPILKQVFDQKLNAITFIKEDK